MMENLDSNETFVEETNDNVSKENETMSNKRSDLLGFEDSSLSGLVAENRNSSTDDFALVETKSTSNSSNDNFSTNSRNPSHNSIMDFEEVSMQSETMEPSNNQNIQQNTENKESGQPSIEQITNNDDFSSFDGPAVQTNSNMNTSDHLEFTDFASNNDFTDFTSGESNNDDFGQNFVSSNDNNDFEDFADFQDASTTDFPDTTSQQTVPVTIPAPIPAVPSIPLFQLEEIELRDKLTHAFQDAFVSHVNISILETNRLKTLTILIQEQQQSITGTSTKSHGNAQGLFGLSKHCTSIKNNLMASIADNLVSPVGETPGSPLRLSLRASHGLDEVDIVVDQNMSEDELNRQAATRNLLINQILSFELEYGKKLEDLVKIMESTSSGTQRPGYCQVLDDIHNVHSKLVQNIKQRISTWDREINADRIGDVFLQMTTSLDCYQQYKKSYNAMIEAVTNVSPKLKTTLQGMQFSVNDVRKLLNAPNERIGQYIHQLEDLAVNTQKTHEDYHLLTYACELLKTLQNSTTDQDLELPQTQESANSPYADLRKMFITKDSGMSMTNDELNRLANKFMEKITELSIELTKELDLKDIQERQKEEKSAKVKDLLESTNVQPQDLKQLQTLKLST